MTKRQAYFEAIHSVIVLELWYAFYCGDDLVDPDWYFDYFEQHETLKEMNR